MLHLPTADICMKISNPNLALGHIVQAQGEDCCFLGGLSAQLKLIPAERCIRATLGNQLEYRNPELEAVSLLGRKLLLPLNECDAHS